MDESKSHSAPEPVSVAEFRTVAEGPGVQRRRQLPEAGDEATPRWCGSGARRTDPPRANRWAGKIKHRGGLKFTNVFNGRSLEVKDFTIDLTKGRLTGLVAGTKTRVPVFKLDLTTAHVRLGEHKAQATDVTLKLTEEAAGALNTTLKTKVFSTGLTVGTADTQPTF